jgi:hypothetical protein
VNRVPVIGFEALSLRSTGPRSVLMVSSNVALISPSTGAHFVPAAGDVLVTKGGVVSGAGLVVNVHTNGATIALPDTSVTAVVMVAV